MARIWRTVVEVYHEWQARGCAQLAAGLAFYGVLAFAGACLVALYTAVWLSNRTHSDIGRRLAAPGGKADTQVLSHLLQTAAQRHDAWVALAAGIVLFVAAVAISALLLQDGLAKIWEIDRNARGGNAASAAGRHIPQFIALLGLSFLLVALLYGGAVVHALADRTHRLSFMSGVLFQAVDLAAGVIVLTVVFLCIFAFVSPVRAQRRKVWLAAAISAVLYERGQFGLALYIGQMDPNSPYADVGAFTAIILWILYSAEVVYAGAVLTKVLNGAQEEKRRRR